MKRPLRIAFISVLVCVSSILGVFLFLSHVYVSSEGNKKYSAVFNDLQYKHLPMAKKNAFGSAPLQNRNSFSHQCQELRRIRSNRNYKVAHLTHSLPYLTPHTEEELRSISKDFQVRNKQNGLPYCRILVTSLLRTAEDIERLREVNANSTLDSPHLYGTTFDIAWSFYQCPKRDTDGNQYLSSLAEVLKEHRDAGKIYVRYETKERCFHITVR